MLYPKEHIDALRQVPLQDILTTLGATPDQYDPHKWHTSQGVLSVSGAKFMNWNLATGGGGAIDLVMHLTTANFKHALSWLDTHYHASNISNISHPVLPAQTKKTFIPPTPAPQNLTRIKHYLQFQRSIDQNLIAPLIRAGTLYADQRANAVFLLLGKNKTPVGAELRSITTPWRGLTPGSRKDRGFFFAPALKHPPSAFVLCESAIDAISCSALYPHYATISTAGARPAPAWLPTLIQRGLPIYCGYDADWAGDTTASRMLAIFPTIKRLRPPFSDWNDLIQTTKIKPR